MFQYKFIVEYRADFNKFCIRMIDTDIDVVVTSGDFLIVIKEIEFMNKEEFKNFSKNYSQDMFQLEN